MLPDTVDKVAKNIITESYEPLVPISLSIAKLTRESYIQFHSALRTTSVFCGLFNFLECKAAVMTYWDGNRKTLNKNNATDMQKESLLYLLIYFEPLVHKSYWLGEFLWASDNIFEMGNFITDIRKSFIIDCIYIGNIIR